MSPLIFQECRFRVVPFQVLGFLICWTAAVFTFQAVILKCGLFSFYLSVSFAVPAWRSDCGTILSPEKFTEDTVMVYC